MFKLIHNASSEYAFIFTARLSLAVAWLSQGKEVHCPLTAERWFSIVSPREGGGKVTVLTGGALLPSSLNRDAGDVSGVRVAHAQRRRVTAQVQG